MDPSTKDAIRTLILESGGEPESFEGSLLTQQILTTLKMIPDGLDTGQLKLITAALKEMRYAYRVFNRYRNVPKISIFGSARTPEDHPDYIAALNFSRQMAEHKWMAITGAGDGIMKAGHEGPQREASFGLSIRLPFETTANTVIEGDPKLINFRYFFTRKLMFMTHADAIAVFPGGFGTQDELFESLTLIQTGKSNIVPVVFLAGAESTYWEHWNNYVRKSLLENGWISEDDPSLYYMAQTPADGVEHVLRFYSTYHSSRYVRDTLVMRMRRTLTDEHIDILNGEFGFLLRDGRIERTTAREEETEHRDLPRIAFHHNRRQYGSVRRLIDRINDLGATIADDVTSPGTSANHLG
ncbi:MAG: LOG family protein [Phycisphaerales bacterium]|nr:LOG family protein [Phycisphaerales bacterium]